MLWVYLEKRTERGREYVYEFVSKSEEEIHLLKAQRTSDPDNRKRKEGQRKLNPQGYWGKTETFAVLTWLLLK